MCVCVWGGGGALVMTRSYHYVSGRSNHHNGRILACQLLVGFYRNCLRRSIMYKLYIYLFIISHLYSTLFKNKIMLKSALQSTTRQSEMADLARRATSVCTKFHRDRLRND